MGARLRWGNGAGCAGSEAGSGGAAASPLSAPSKSAGARLRRAEAVSSSTAEAGSGGAEVSASSAACSPAGASSSAAAAGWRFARAGFWGASG